MHTVKSLGAVAIAGFLSLCLIGCGGNKQTVKVGSDAPEPIDQEIVQKASKKAPQEVPPGYTVNSGGQLVKISEGEENQ